MNIDDRLPPDGPSRPFRPVPSAPPGRFVDIDVTPASPYKLLFVLLLIAAGSWVFYREAWPLLPHHSPSPAPETTGQKLGKAFVPKLAASLADGMDVFAASIRGGDTIEKADTELKTTFAASRAKAFAASIGPEMARIVPEGTDAPKDELTKQELAAFAAGVAKGLRGTR